MNFVQSLKGKNCLVIGAGVTGRACQVALINFGANSKLFDEKVKTGENIVNQIPDGIE